MTYTVRSSGAKYFDPRFSLDQRVNLHSSSHPPDPYTQAVLSLAALDFLKPLNALETVSAISVH